MWGMVFFIVLIDQLSKVLIKTNMSIGESLWITDWFCLYFVENNGFAFGFEFLGDLGKFLLTSIRLFFVFFIIIFLNKLLERGVSGVVVFSFILVISGAIGNLIDSLFYGVVFNYAPLFYGRVVDMFYFPLFQGNYPGWIPFIGGDDFVFFGYIFNIADSAITIGACFLFFLYNKIPLKD